MKKTDGRKFNTETQQQIRYIAIKLRKSGKTYVEIARILDIHYIAVIKWWIFYEEKGYNGLLIRKRGVRVWTRQAIQNLIINFWGYFSLFGNSWEIHEKAWIHSTKTD